MIAVFLSSSEFVQFKSKNIPVYLWAFLSAALQSFKNPVITSAFFVITKNPKVFPVLSAVCVCLCVVVYVFALLLDNGIISMGQIAALAESSARTLSANISALSPAA